MGFPRLNLRSSPGATARTVTFACALLASGSAFAINPLDLIGAHPKAFVEPEGYYQVILPGGFNCEEVKGKKREIKCQGTRGAQALLVIRVQDVPRSATADLVALNEMERLKKKPHFKLIDSRRETVHGVPARLEKFSYDYLGNVEHSVGVQALYLVKNTKLYVLHFESRLSSFATYAKDLVELYGTFKPAELDEGGNPILERPEEKRSGKVRSDEDFMEREAQRLLERDAALKGDE